jgi:hypothetical protein
MLSIQWFPQFEALFVRTVENDAGSAFTVPAQIISKAAARRQTGNGTQ